jgi:Tfp pilus assembly protein PilO
LAFFCGANTAIRSQVAELQSTVDRAQQMRAKVHATPAAAVDSFVNELPARAELPALTEKIVAAASAAGIALERGTYDLAPTRTGRLVRVRMTFPVHARYPDIRRFVDATLATIPGAAVDGLRLERKDIAAAEVDANIRFALYLRSSP